MPSSPDPRKTYEGPWARPVFDDLEPPGTYASVVNRFGSGGITDIGVVHEHRFAFWFWNRWVRESRRSSKPALVTIDWHQDLCAPHPDESAALAALDTANDSEVALFAWSQLHPHNDGHILAAAELGIIGDVHVLCRQDEGEESDGYSDSVAVRVYHDPEAFGAVIRDVPETILDIDLDYFTRSSDPCGGGNHVKLVSYNEVERILNPRTGILAPLLPHVMGITIAIEPEFCGGLRNAHRLLDAANRILFGRTLLTEDVRWNSHE